MFLGFPLGGMLSLSIMVCAALVMLPRGIEVSTLGQVGLPVALALGKVGIAFALLGFVAATFGAACETGLSVGYSVAQFYGWQWGKFVSPARASRFHLLILSPRCWRWPSCSPRSTRSRSLSTPWCSPQSRCR